MPPKPRTPKDPTPSTPKKEAPTILSVEEKILACLERIEKYLERAI